MKIYKVVTPFEVERWTMEGWELDKVLSHAYADKVGCNTPVSKHVPDSCYGGIETHLREELVQVHEPLFLLCKEMDLISREQSLINEKEDLKKKLDLQKKERDQWEQTANRLQRDCSLLEESKKIAVAEREIEQERARKLEKDIAKLRGALGDLRMKEILGG